MYRLILKAESTRHTSFPSLHEETMLATHFAFGVHKPTNRGFRKYFQVHFFQGAFPLYSVVVVQLHEVIIDFFTKYFGIYLVVAGIPTIYGQRDKPWGIPATVNSGIEILRSPLASLTALFILSTLKCVLQQGSGKCFVLPVIIISLLFLSTSLIVSPIKYLHAPAAVLNNNCIINAFFNFVNGQRLCFRFNISINIKIFIIKGNEFKKYMLA